MKCLLMTACAKNFDCHANNIIHNCVYSLTPQPIFYLMRSFTYSSAHSSLDVFIHLLLSPFVTRCVHSLTPQPIRHPMRSFTYSSAHSSLDAIIHLLLSPFIVEVSFIHANHDDTANEKHDAEHKECAHAAVATATGRHTACSFTTTLAHLQSVLCLVW